MTHADTIKMFFCKWIEYIRIIFRKEHLPILYMFFYFLRKIFVFHRTKTNITGISFYEIPFYMIMKIIEYRSNTYEFMNLYIETFYEMHRQKSSHRMSYNNRIFIHLRFILLDCRKLLIEIGTIMSRKIWHKYLISMTLKLSLQPCLPMPNYRRSFLLPSMKD